MELKSSSVLSPLKRAKSTVCAPFRIETGVEEPSERVMLCTLTAKETTFGRGASVPSTYTEPVCAGVDVELPLPPGALRLPELQPATHAITAVDKNTRMPWVYFINRPCFPDCLSLRCRAPEAITAKV